MYESVACEHMPKTATARNKATNWNKGGMLFKQMFYFLKKMGRLGGRKRKTFWCGLINKIYPRSVTWKRVGWPYADPG